MNELRTIDDLLDKNGAISFELLRHENGNIYWLASEIMQKLGYDDMKKFYRAINRANKAMTGLGIDPFQNIARVDQQDGSVDYKLTRFACYLTVMNADPKKPEVAAAQVYFIALTRQFELWLEDPEDVTRVAFRQEIKEQNKRLSGAATGAGVHDYPYFVNAGYLGMYNMMNVELADRRGIKKSELLEYMGTPEMAANLFRIEMTKARLERSGVIGQRAAEEIHHDVGRKVRNMVKESTGKNPEDLPVARRLPDINKQLKLGHRQMRKIDGESPQKKTGKKSLKKNNP